MLDLLFILLAIALFIVSAAYVDACERLTRSYVDRASDRANGGRS